PDLFTVPAEVRLTQAERTAADEAARLIAALGDFDYEGTGLACVAGIDAVEAVRRLEAVPAQDEAVAELLERRYADEMDETFRIVGVTSVPGGCVVTQPWGYVPHMPGVMNRLSAGTVCYGLYASPSSGDQGSIARDGAMEDWDLSPGSEPGEGDAPEEVLASYLYRDNSVAFACSFAGLRPTDARPVTGPADLWVQLPERDYWEEENDPGEAHCLHAPSESLPPSDAPPELRWDALG
ncbi:hypothetical protein JBE27_39825, partial [Streptomyces albiflaviniger]|nr:hypothetical protein [Streptomyces albiflaviniger]